MKLANQAYEPVPKRDDTPSGLGWGGRIGNKLMRKNCGSKTCAKTCRIDVCCRKPNWTSKWIHIIYPHENADIRPFSHYLHRYLWHLLSRPLLLLGLGIQQVLSQRLRFIYMAIVAVYIYMCVCVYEYIYILRIFLETMSFKL